jgi:hypothetical protein
MDESLAGQISEGIEVEVVRSNTPPAISKAQVVSVSPAIEQLPVQLWRNKTVPQWGRAFLVRASAEMNLLVGEKVGIRKL